MALAQLSVFSPSLRRISALHVVLPDGLTASAMRVAPVLILLHGWSGSQYDWLVGSDVVRYAQERGLVVVLPAGENHFYLDDQEMEESYSRWIVDDIPQLLSVLFGISWEPRRGYLGGLSMGGYGALRNGLAFPDRFGGLIGLSSALITRSIATLKPGERTPYAGYSYYRRVFGDLTKLEGSDNDPEALVARLAQEGSQFPRLYVACGTEDFLLEDNRSFVRCLSRWSVPHLAIETAGGHDFAFWNAQIQRAIDWMFEGSGT